MTFAAPLFLLAALAAAIPVALHMMQRRTAKELPFATLRFLKISVEKTRRRKRIEDAALMALRVGALLLIAAGLARPAITRLGGLWGGNRGAAVVVLDNSASMGMIDEDRVRFETAVAAAGRILDQMGDGDRVAVLPTCGPAFPAASRLARTQDAARQALDQCRMSYERADLAEKVREARTMLAASDVVNKHVFVVTDMQAVSWGREAGRGESGERRAESGERNAPRLRSRGQAKGEDGERKTENGGGEGKADAEKLPIVVIDCDRAPKPNVAVENLDVETAAPVAGVPVTATVALLNTSEVTMHPRVELLVDGVVEATSPELSLRPEGRAKHEFAFRFRGAGLHRGEVRLAGEDGSKYDDRRFFAVEADQAVPVAIVKARSHEIASLDDAYYLEQALALGGAFRPATILAADPSAAEWDTYKVVFCVNLPALDDDAAARLRAYAAGGGSVVWVFGDNCDPAAYNAMNQRAGGQLLPAPLGAVRAPEAKSGRDSWHIAFLDKTHPALGSLVDPPSLYESVLVYRHVGIGPIEGGAKVLARLDDGEPLLVERAVERGRVLMLGTEIHVNGSNLPLRPIFLPLISRLVFDLARIEQARHDVIAGRPLVIPSTDGKHSSGIEVVAPGGETVRLKADGGTNGDFRFADTREIGVYLVRPLGSANPQTAAYSVNFDPEEAEPAKLDRQSLSTALGDAPLVVAEDPNDLSATFAQLREGTSVGEPLLALVLVVLVFETFLSNRFARPPK